MKLLRQPAKMEMVVASGLLRVTVRPSQHWAPLTFQAVTAATFAALLFSARSRMSSLEFIFATLSVLGAIVAWFGHLFGWEEVIEFDAGHLRIRNEVFAWERTREYPIAECSDLGPQDLTGRPHGLQCRLGRRTIEFGDYLSEQQGIEVVSALEDALPDIVQTLLPSVDISKDLMKLV